MNGLPYYKAYQELRASLVADGWRTPNTYCSIFAPIEDIPAVYAFLAIQDFTFDHALVAYVGMSKNLKARMSSHEIIPQISGQGHWVTTWFKPTPVHILRDTERQYIQQFDPPWNIACRKRGVTLQ